MRDDLHHTARAILYTTILIAFAYLLTSCSTSDKQELPEIPIEIATPVPQTESNQDWLFNFSSDFTTMDLKRDIYFLDPKTPQTVIDSLKAQGKTIYGYISVGSWEDGRSDSDQLGKYKYQKMKGWSEYWLNLNKWEEIIPIMKARMIELQQRGFNGFYCDNPDIFHNTDGLNLADNVSYLQAIANAGKDLGLSVGINNGLLMLPSVADAFDFFVGEECLEQSDSDYDECAYYNIVSPKPVYHIEYDREYCKPYPNHSVRLYDYDLSKELKKCD